jgi:hypothetical protein
MLTRRAFAALASVTAVAGQAAAQTASGPRRAEVETLRRFAEATHPRGRGAAADEDWRARWERLAAEADGLSIGAYFIRTRRALGWFKDGHTCVLPFEFVGGPPEGPLQLALPFRARAFHDGIYVVAAKDEAAALNGARITRIGRMESAALVRAVAQDWPGSDAWAHRWAGYHFSKPALLEGLGAINDPAAPVVVEATLGTRRVRVNLRPRIGAEEALADAPRARAPREAWAEVAGGGNYVRSVGRAIYISCDAMQDLDAFVAFTRQCFAAMESADADRVVFDLRRNGGGNNFLPEALRKRMLRSRFNRPGGLYVLTSPATFSAAQNPATRLERDSFAIFVGEPTGGAPNHYGDAQAFRGEASGLTSIVSTIPWFDSYPQDMRPWIAPDLHVPDTFADFSSGMDRAFDLALTHTTDAEANEIDEARIFYYERPSQGVEWRPFWRS